MANKIKVVVVEELAIDKKAIMEALKEAFIKEVSEATFSQWLPRLLFRRDDLIAKGRRRQPWDTKELQEIGQQLREIARQADNLQQLIKERRILPKSTIKS